MGRFRQPPDRTQLTFLPMSVDQFVGPDDDVRFVDAFVESLDLSEIESAFSDLGRPAYAPRTLVKLLVYGRLRGVRTGRGLAEAAEENMRFYWLLGGEKPDFRTICDFRKRFAPQLGDLLKQTIDVGVREGVIRLERVAIDGTIIRASAGSGTFRRRESLERELERLDLSFQPDVDADEVERESSKDDDDDTGHQLPEHLRDPEERRRRIRAALDELDQAKKDGRRLKRVSTTDPQCRFIESRSGRNAAYNAQAAVDIESGMIVGAYVTNDVSDGAQLVPMLEQIEENTERNPKTVLADRGYNGLAGLQALEDRGIDGRIPVNQPRSDVFGLERFAYDESTDTYRCPDGRTLKRHSYQPKQRRTSYYSPDCTGCTMASECIGQGKRRTLTVSDLLPLKQAMIAKMTDPEVAASYSERASSIEPVFGNVKANRGLRAFLVRGLQRVSDDWRFEMLVTNVQKLKGLLPTTPIPAKPRAI